MTRVSLIRDKAVLDEAGQNVFETIAKSRGEVAGPFPLLLHVPALAEKIASLGTEIRFESSIPAIEQKMAALVVAAETNCSALTVIHAPSARKMGISENLVEAILQKRTLDEGEYDLVHYARTLLRSESVGQPLFDRMQARYGTAGLVMLTATLGYYAMLAYLMNAFELSEVQT